MIAYCATMDDASSHSGLEDHVPDWDRTCIFCGGRPLSKEHIFPKWLHPLLPKTGRLNHQSLFQLDTIEGTEARTKTSSGESYAGRLRVVCERCNNGWMSQLQEEVIPVLGPVVQGDPMTLSRRQLHALSAWVAMFVMVTEWRAMNVQFVATSRNERYSFRANGQVPRSWRIWMASSSLGDELEQFQRTTLPISSKNGAGVGVTSSGKPVPNTHSTTIRIGRLLVHVLGSIHKDWIRRQTFPRRSPMQQIWPIQTTPIIWPTEREIELGEAKDLADALGRIARNINFRRKLERVGVSKP